MVATEMASPMLPATKSQGYLKIIFPASATAFNGQFGVQLLERGIAVTTCDASYLVTADLRLNIR